VYAYVLRTCGGTYLLTYIHMYIHTYTHAQTHTYTYTYTYMHADRVREKVGGIKGRE